MSVSLLLHLLALGVWIGVVGAEFAIEFHGMRDKESLRTAAELHYKTDLWIEVPAIAVVLVSGLLMLGEIQPGAILWTKIAFALLAIAFNVVCVYAVWKRRVSLRAADAAGLARANRAMKISAAVIPTFLVAFALAIYLA